MKCEFNDPIALDFENIMQKFKFFTLLKRKISNHIKESFFCKEKINLKLIDSFKNLYFIFKSVSCSL